MYGTGGLCAAQAAGVLVGLAITASWSGAWWVDPAIGLGVAVYWMLPETLQDASWLTDAERKHLTSMIEQEHSGDHGLNKRDLLAVIFNVRVWILALLTTITDAITIALPVRM